MMGGGSARYEEPASDSARQKAQAAREQERERLVGEINQHLSERLVRFNDRDVDRTNDRLQDIAEALSERASLETVLFGGSVAKQTAVQGLSDVDALVVLSDAELINERPGDVLETFCETLRVELNRADVVRIEKGALAVTVEYRDGTEVQLLPAVRDGGRIEISSTSGRSWITTDPTAFREALTQANARAGRALVPAIKLVKAIVAQLPEQKQISGYHAEALAIDAVGGYEGPRKPRSLVLAILDHASRRVMDPIPDVTGQSRNVDDYLGAPGSVERRNVAQALHWLARRLQSATSVGQWDAALGPVDD